MPSLHRKPPPIQQRHSSHLSIPPLQHLRPSVVYEARFSSSARCFLSRGGQGSTQNAGSGLLQSTQGSGTTQALLQPIRCGFRALQRLMEGVEEDLRAPSPEQQASQTFRPIREDEVFRMMRKLSTAGAGEVTNLSRMMLSLTGTLICRVAFGKRLDDEGGTSRMKFDQLMTESQAMLGGLFVSDYIPAFGWVDRLSGMIGRLDKVYKKFDHFFEELIDEHTSRQNSGDHNNILDILIHLKEDKSCSIALTWDHVKAILMDLFVAGTDTGAATVIWAMTALIKNPAAMHKLQNEIRESVGNKGEVNEDDLPKLDYLKAVIKEVLRLYPPAPLLLPRETLTPCNISGYTIPPKTMVIVNAWAIARDPEYWESPNEFKPERFLNSNVDIIGQNFEVIPFGAGRRGCPGISMGLATVELLLANLVYSFDWQLPPGMSSGEDIDVQVSPGLAVHKKNPLCLVPINAHLRLL